MVGDELVGAAAIAQTVQPHHEAAAAAARAPGGGHALLHVNWEEMAPEKKMLLLAGLLVLPERLCYVLTW